MKYLVPVVAVIVLAESVVLISQLKGKPLNQSKQEGENQVGEVVDNLEETRSGDEVYQIELTADATEYKVGQVGKVEVKMLGKIDKSLDSINVYVKYDPNMFEVNELKFDDRLPAPVFSKVSTLRGLLVANFLISDPKGLELSANDQLTLMTFNMKAVKTGNYDFEISTGKEMKESATMIVENGSGKPVSFSSNKLTVKVIE
ncbi:hypothetical protein HYV64_05300 [Candidatus Shapirobacteria bacterium]|nr:hypothetical protein [Candidatus Shapirobacteria bacterium]